MNFGRVFGLLLLLSLQKEEAHGGDSSAYCYDEAPIITKTNVIASYGKTSDLLPDGAVSIVPSYGSVDVTVKNVWPAGSKVYFSWRSADDVNQFDCLDGDGLDYLESATREAQCSLGAAEVRVFVDYDPDDDNNLCSDCKHPEDDSTSGVSYTFEFECKPVCGAECYGSPAVTDYVSTFGEDVAFPGTAFLIIGSTGDKLQFEATNAFGQGLLHVSYRTDEGEDVYACLEDGLEQGESLQLEALCVLGVAEIGFFVSYEGEEESLCSECKHPVDPNDGASFVFELPCVDLCEDAPTPGPTPGPTFEPTPEPTPGPSPKPIEPKSTDCYESAAITGSDVVAMHGDFDKTPFPENAFTLISSANGKLEFEVTNEWTMGDVYVAWRSEDSVDQFECLDEGLAKGASAEREALCVYGVAEIRVFVDFYNNDSPSLCSMCKHPDEPGVGVSYTFELACDPLCLTADPTPGPTKGTTTQDVTPGPTAAPTIGAPASVILKKTVKECGEPCSKENPGVESLTLMDDPSHFHYCYEVVNPPDQKPLCGCFLNDALTKSEFTTGVSGGMVIVEPDMQTDCIPSGESVMVDGPCFESPFVDDALSEDEFATVTCKPSPSGDVVTDEDDAEAIVPAPPTPGPTPGPTTASPTPGPTDHCPNPMDMGKVTGSEWGKDCKPIHKGVELVGGHPKFDESMNMEPFYVLPSIKDIFYDIQPGKNKYHVKFKAMNPLGGSAHMYIRYETEHAFTISPDGAPGREPVCIGDEVGKCESVQDAQEHEAICLDPTRHGQGTGTYALVTVYIADNNQNLISINDGTEVNECCEDIGTPAAASVISYKFQIMCECPGK